MSHHYETATAGRKAIASVHKTHPTSGAINFQLSKNEKLHVRLRRREVLIEIETLQRNIKFHETDVDPDRDLAHLLNNWRRRLQELKLLL
jgi:hypothetical protein